MITVPVFQITQPVGDFYIGVMRADHLFSICKYDYRRMQYVGTHSDFLGIQREISPNRVKNIKKYVGTADACFPSSIVISIDEKCATIEDTNIVGGYSICHRTNCTLLSETSADTNVGFELPHDLARIRIERSSQTKKHHNGR